MEGMLSSKTIAFHSNELENVKWFTTFKVYLNLEIELSLKLKLFTITKSSPYENQFVFYLDVVD